MGTPQLRWIFIALSVLLCLSTTAICNGLRGPTNAAPPAAQLTQQRGAAEPPTRARLQRGAAATASAGGPAPRRSTRPAVPGAVAESPTGSRSEAAVRALRLASVRVPTPDGPTSQEAPVVTVPSPAFAPSAASTLFVISAKVATLTQLGKGRNASLMLEGVDPWTTWFVDKPVRRGGRLLTSRLFGEAFLQDDGTWSGLPNLAMYSSSAADGSVGDRVVVLSTGANPKYSNFSDSSTITSSLPNLVDGSLTFPIVSFTKWKIADNTVAAYYSGISGTFSDGPTVLNASVPGSLSRNTVFSNVALFVEPLQCGCSVLGTCGCPNKTEVAV